MSDEDVKHAYWRRIRGLTLFMTVLAVGVAVVLPMFMSSLNAYRFLRFPLGYFLVAHAGVIVLAVLVYALFAGQERNDRDYNMTIQF